MTVYFIEGAGLIKIGYTSADSPEERLADLQTSSPFVLRVLAFAPGDAAIESNLHQRFAESNAHREWFHPHRDLLRMIAYVQKFGTVDGFDDWEEAPALLTLRQPASVLNIPDGVHRQLEALNRSDERIAPSEYWSVFWALWNRSELPGFVVAEGDTIVTGDDADLFTPPVDWQFDGCGTGLRGVRRTAELLLQQQGHEDAAERAACIWMLGAARELSRVNIIRSIPGARAFEAGARWRLGNNTSGLWHHATSAVFPVDFLPDGVVSGDDPLESAEQFVVLLQQLRRQCLLMGRIVDNRAALERVRLADAGRVVNETVGVTNV